MGRSVTEHGRNLWLSGCRAFGRSSHHFEAASGARAEAVVVGNEVKVVDSSVRRAALSGDLAS